VLCKSQSHVSVVVMFAIIARLKMVSAIIVQVMIMLIDSADIFVIAGAICLVFIVACVLSDDKGGRND